MKVVQVIIEYYSFDESWSTTVRVAANKEVAKKWIEKHIHKILEDWHVDKKTLKSFKWHGDLFESQSPLYSEEGTFISLKETTLIE